MENNRYYIAQRNNYFFGKLMTAKDFINEQKYFNSKRYLCNRILNGLGIVSGLDVILMDNRTFSLETGMAIDYLGREIIVSEPSIRKLNVIKGFEENKEKHTVYLCIRYKEKFSESTFSLASVSKEQGGDRQYNRISEGYELFLTSNEPSQNELTLDFLIKRRTEIYNNGSVKITAESEKYINSNKFTQIRIFFEKEKTEDAISYSFDLYGNLFKSNENSKIRNIIVKYDETEVTTYKNIKKDYFLYCDAQESILTEIIIPKDSFSINIGKEKYEINKNISIPIQVVTEDIRNLIIKDYYARHFDEILELVENKYIYLAKFNIINNKTSYFIEEFKKNPFEQYLYSNELLKLLQEFQGVNVKTIGAENKFNLKTSSEENKNFMKKDKDSESKNYEKNNIISGVERINLGFNAKSGKVYYSYDFVHGLGAGEVGVIACVVNHKDTEEHENSLLLFGDKSIFSQEEVRSSTPSAQIAAAVDITRGTMKLGIRLLEKTINTHLDIRWWVFKSLKEPNEYKDLVLEQNVKLNITPNTVSIVPFGQVRFEANLEGINDQRIKWEMALKNTGNIDNNGLYSAPATEGVYEIKAYSVKMPEINNTAYVVVSTTSNVSDNNKHIEEEKSDKSSKSDEKPQKNDKKDENKE